MNVRTYDRYGNTVFVEGNTLRSQLMPALDDREGLRVAHPKRGSKRNAVSGTYLAFLCVMLFAMIAVLTWYISLRSGITESINEIAVLESRLNDLKQSNDEEYNKAVSSIDLDEIKNTAIYDYGMQYASEDQIIKYSDGGGEDYVRQNSAIPGN